MIREHLVKAHPARDGDFRWRGDGVSRVEGLSDAVFGFAVTLLVVSLEVPSTFTELADMMLGVPAFAITFVLLLIVWHAHYKFFRRYGLEDRRTVVLNAGLLFVVLLYIYPLKFLFQTIVGLTMALAAWKLDIAWLDGTREAALGAIRPDQWPALLSIYAVGYIALYGLFALLHRHALSQRDVLELDAVETAITRHSIRESLVMIAVAVLSVVIVLGGAYGLGWPPWVAGFLGGWSYMLIWPAQTIMGKRHDRELTALRAARLAPA
ncbi:TMEM175 family protein [Roseisolibacter sp. H3M3-2]|uniref:TMEM175 family protein n=1 Tax=Roseisolibacter sp. H3M3-2 TaxID=3031323 RepID=UPI0023DBCBCC|nr:TMEM175 family protein [Roseisolibacter sp. H3M3-2]MDF1504794.1 TMEM175 family protein [Roseisolibacter sp. H3M3-2]